MVVVFVDGEGLVGVGAEEEFAVVGNAVGGADEEGVGGVVRVEVIVAFPIVRHAITVRVVGGDDEMNGGRLLCGDHPIVGKSGDRGCPQQGTLWEKHLERNGNAIGPEMGRLVAISEDHSRLVRERVDGFGGRAEAVLAVEEKDAGPVFRPHVPRATTGFAIHPLGMLVDRSSEDTGELAPVIDMGRRSFAMQGMPIPNATFRVVEARWLEPPHDIAVGS